MKKVLSFSLVIFLLYSSFSVTQISAGTDIQRSIFSKTPSKVASGGVALAAGLYAWRLHSQIKEIDAELDQIEKQATGSKQQALHKQELTDKRSQLRLRFILFTLLATGGGATLAYGVGHQFIQNRRIKELMKNFPIKGKISPQDIERMTQGKDNNYLFKYVGAGKDVSVFERKTQLRPGLFYDRYGYLASPGNLPEELEDLKDNQTKGLIAERFGISVGDIGRVFQDNHGCYYFEYVGAGKDASVLGKDKQLRPRLVYDEYGDLVSPDDLPKELEGLKDNQIKYFIAQRLGIPVGDIRRVHHDVDSYYFFKYVGDEKIVTVFNADKQLRPDLVYDKLGDLVSPDDFPREFEDLKYNQAKSYIAQRLDIPVDDIGKVYQDKEGSYYFQPERDFSKGKVTFRSDLIYYDWGGLVPSNYLPKELKDLSQIRVFLSE